MTWRTGETRAIVFDVDDTLVDTASAWQHAVSHMCRRISDLVPQVDAEDIWSSYQEFSNALWEDYDRSLAPLGPLPVIRSHIWQKSITACNIHLHDDVLMQLVSDFDAVQMSAYTPDPALIDLLGQLSGRFRFAVCSNSDGVQTRRKLERAGILDFFDVIVCGIDERIRKPEPELFMRCLAALEVPGESCLYVGDDWRNDVVGSMSAGLRPVWIQPDSSRMTPGPAAVIRYSTVTAFLSDVLTLSQNFR